MRISQPGITFTAFGIVLLSALLTACQKELHFDFTGVDLELAGEGFVSPVQVVSSHQSERLYVVDQVGKIWVIDREGYRRPKPFLDLSSKLVSLNPAYDERGLLGLALHPEFKTNGRFYVYYQLPPRPGGPTHGIFWNNLSRISEFTVLPDVLRADMDSEKVIS